jgi:hypothetical protein
MSISSFLRRARSERPASEVVGARSLSQPEAGDRPPVLIRLLADGCRRSASPPHPLLRRQQHGRTHGHRAGSVDREGDGCGALVVGKVDDGVNARADGRAPCASAAMAASSSRNLRTTLAPAASRCQDHGESASGRVDERALRCAQCGSRPAGAPRDRSPSQASPGTPNRVGRREPADTVPAGSGSRSHRRCGPASSCPATCERAITLRSISPTGPLTRSLRASTSTSIA